MEHLDPETLSLLALGEHAASVPERAHLAQCPPCAEELAALERVVAAGRTGTDQPALDRPDEALWSRISAELDLGEQGEGDADLDVEDREGGGLDAEGREGAGLDAEGREGAGLDAQDGDNAGLDAEDRDGAQVVPAGQPPRPSHTPDGQPRGTARAPERRWRRSAWIAAAAFLFGIGTAVVADRVLTPTEPEPPVLATAQLEPEPHWSQIDGGAAALHDVDGRTVLRVELAEDPEDGFREVWLIDSDLERLVSLGVLVGAEGVFDIPAGLDLDDFVIVDVSAEPYDGDPAHSGDSIVRGELS